MIRGICEDVLRKVYDFSEMTNEELRCKFFQKLQECIDLCNNSADILEWIKNEGIEKEVKELLNLWLEDGTLENLININKINTVKAELESKINKVVNAMNNDSINNEPYFVTTFNAHDGYNLDMYISYENDEFIPITGKGIVLDDYVRDPSPLFYNGKFYVGFTCNGVAIAESDDLVNWKITRIRNNSTERFMAPEFIVDNNNVYIALSYTDGTKSGNLYVYKTKFLKANEDLTQWNDIGWLNINSAPSNYIDATFLKDNSKWHMFLKIENTGEIQQYKADNLLGPYNLTGTINTNRPCEGITCKKRGNVYCLYLDNYLDGYASVIYSIDLVTWFGEKTINVTDGTRCQHFDLLKLNDESKIIVNNAIKKYNNENAGFKLSRNGYGYRMMKVKDFITGTVFNPPLFDNTIYTFDEGDENITLTEINVPNPQGRYELYFMFTKGTTSNEFIDGITLKNSFGTSITGNGGIRTPGYNDYLIGYQLRSSLVKLVYKGRDYTDKNYWLVESTDKDYIAPPVKYLEDIQVEGVIDTLTPTNNQYYALAQDIDITINKIDTSKMSKDGKFYIVMKLSSVTTKTITIKSGGDGNDFIGKRSNDLSLSEPDYIYSFMKENGSKKCRQLGS